MSNNPTSPCSPTLEIQGSRQLWLDVLRVIATFGVIFLHVTGEGYHLPIGEYNWYVALLGDSIVRWSVPVFVMISGVLFLNPLKDISKNIMLRKYIPRLLLAYLFWSLAYSLYSMFLSSVKAGMPVVSVELLEPHFHLWFLPMLMGVYLLVPLLRSIASNKEVMSFSLMLWATYLSVNFCMRWEIPQISPLFVMNVVVGYAGYFLLGYYVTQNDISRRQRSFIYLLGMLGAIVTIAGNIALSFCKGVPDETFLSNTSPFVVLMSLTLFVGVKYNAYRIGHITRRFIEYVRRDLFGIYLVHGFWLLIFNRGLFRDMTNHLVSIPLITLAVFAGSLYTTKLLRQVPGLKRVVE